MHAAQMKHAANLEEWKQRIMACRASGLTEREQAILLLIEMRRFRMLYFSGDKHASHKQHICFKVELRFASYVQKRRDEKTALNYT